MANFNPLGYTGRVTASTARLGDAEFDPSDFNVSENGVVTLDPTGAVQTISGDSGGNRPPTAGNIVIAGGTNITTAGAASTITVNLDASLTNLTSVASTTITTNVAAAQLSLSGTTVSAAGTDANISITLTPKGTGIVAIDNLGFDGNTISSTDVNGDIDLDPNGIGDVNIVSGDFIVAAGDIITSRSEAGVDVTVEATNSDNTSGTSNAFFEAATGGANSGDAGVRFQVSGVATNWSVGLDNSDSDAFVISASNTIGTDNAMRIDHASQDVQFPVGDVEITSGNLSVGGTITADTVSQTVTDITFAQSPLMTTAANTGGAATGATGDVNLMALQTGEIMEQFILGAGQTIIAPRMTTSGLLTSLDLVNTEGAEYNWGMRNNALHTFTIGTSPAFFMELEVTAADVGGLDPFLVGFRKVQANDATLANYTDFVSIGANATTAADVVILQTQLNTGGVVITNTTDAWTDGQTKVFRINVSAAGVVTYTINGAPPTATAAFTFDNGDVVAPFIRHLFGAATPGAINWVQLTVGLQ